MGFWYELDELTVINQGIARAHPSGLCPFFKQSHNDKSNFS